MKKPIQLMFVALILMIGSACGMSTPQPAAGMIDPGDRVGDFLITTGEGENVVFVTRLHCFFNGNTGTESCAQPVGTLVNVGLAVYDNNPFKGPTLDQYWTGQTCDLFIEGRPVNLQAFGSIDIFLPVIGKVRVWNVNIVANHPGTLTTRSRGVVGGSPFDRTVILAFTAP